MNNKLRELLDYLPENGTFYTPDGKRLEYIVEYGYDNQETYRIKVTAEECLEYADIFKQIAEILELSKRITT